MAHVNLPITPPHHQRRLVLLPRPTMTMCRRVVLNPFRMISRRPSLSKLIWLRLCRNCLLANGNNCLNQLNKLKIEFVVVNL